MNEKLVSIILPVYNSEEYIKDTLNSLLNQTYKNLEIILINDCSTDNTERIINSFEDKRIILIKNEKNMGISKTLNKGISISNGEYIARMDSDDICCLNRIEEQVKILESHNEIDVCGTSIKTFGLREDVSVYPISSAEININIMFGCCMAHPTIMFKRRIIKDFVYSSTTKVEDYNLWVELIKKGYKFYNIPKPLLKYRIHETSLSFIKENSDKKTRLVTDYKRTLEKANRELLGVELSDKEIEVLFLNADMITSLNDNMTSIIQTFEKYYNYCSSKMSEADLDILKRALSLKYYEKTVILSKKGQFTNLYFRKAKFNAYKNNIKKNLVLIYLFVKANKR